MTSPSERDRAIFRAVAVEGRPAAEVAAEHGLTAAHLQRIVRKIERLLAERSILEEPPWVRVLHLRRLEHQWNEAMVAWYRSQLPHEVMKATLDPAAKKQRIERTVRPRTGDIRYLEHARKLLAEIRAASRDEHEEQNHDVESLTLEQRETELLALLDRLRERAREDEALGTDCGPIVPPEELA